MIIAGTKIEWFGGELIFSANQMVDYHKREYDYVPYKKISMPEEAALEIMNIINSLSSAVERDTRDKTLSKLRHELKTLREIMW